MLCDITPDFIPQEHLGKKEIDITSCINSNVMCELGYFECLKKNKNVILIMNQAICDSVPSMLRGHYITRYDGVDNIADRCSIPSPINATPNIAPY